MKNIIGIDYGSKLAGTTAICYEKKGMLCLTQSHKKKDADIFVKRFCEEHQPDHIYIDAPLSLPGIYTGIKDCKNYFYRKADVETQAMSPMFLGGLTARAMKLSSELPAMCFEAYPKMLVKTLNITTHYKEDLRLFSHCLLKKFPGVVFQDSVENWHQADALLAYMIGLRHQRGEALVYGDPTEGQILG
ncbi:MAG: hypothetical protein ABJH05_12705 [Fulvivirga sp.]